MNNNTHHIEKLLDKAEDAIEAKEALAFSQAALNAAHALTRLQEYGLLTPK